MFGGCNGGFGGTRIDSCHIWRARVCSTCSVVCADRRRSAVADWLLRWRRRRWWWWTPLVRALVARPLGLSPSLARMSEMSDDGILAPETGASSVSSRERGFHHLTL